MNIDALSQYAHVLKGKKIFLTGHTGFTGSWASLWLMMIGAEVAGISLEPNTEPSLFRELKLEREMQSNIVDITDYSLLQKTVMGIKPDLIIHLAAQALVRKSYETPLETFMINTQGTAHILEAARYCESVKGVVCITTDKVYKNHEWGWAYRENDELGGNDPYSASKAAAELVIESYRKSYPFLERRGPPIAIARGGNIVGGGDWAEDRLIPDFVRAIVGRNRLRIRYPNATRPWQHVLSLIEGYFRLAAGLCLFPESAAKAWNFGPLEPMEYSVKAVLELLSQSWKEIDIDYEIQGLPEAQSLILDSTLARRMLGWEPCWNTKETIQKTAYWYKEFYDKPGAARKLCESQIGEWERDSLLKK